MRTQLTLALTLTLAIASAYAVTPEAIKLDNQKTVASVVTGTCGPATVRITDTEKDPINEMGFHGSYSAIHVQSGKASLKISPDPDSSSGIYLQDRNKLHCITTPTGAKLLLAMLCYARSCAPVDYRVIDTSTAKVINKLNDMDECDAACAQKALGTKLPVELQGGQ